jgi:hypothetical protein
MAKTAKNGASTKTFGGTSVAPGTYHIASAIITEEILKIDGQADKNYDCLQLVLKHDVNGVAGAECDATLSLNGCWRPRRGEDGKRYIAEGSFFTSLLATCQGKSFDQTRDYINANFVNKKISVNYEEYPSQSGGFGRVPKVEFLN